MGNFVYLLYEEGAEDTWHEHIVGPKVSPLDDDTSSGCNDYVIWTADDDKYVEVLAAPPHVAIRFGNGYKLPPGLGLQKHEPVYRFAPDYIPTGDDWSVVYDRLAEIAARELLRNPSRYPPAAPERPAQIVPTPIPVAKPDATDNGNRQFAGITPTRDLVWACIDDDVAIPFGAQVDAAEIDAKGVRLEGHALIKLDDGGVAHLISATPVAMPGLLDARRAPAAVTPRGVQQGVMPEDARTLEVLRNTSQERYRSWRELVESLQPSEFSDWPLDGPRTAQWYAREISKSGLAPLARHHQWATENKLSPDDKLRLQHEALSEVLEVFGQFDQLDLSNLAGAELVARQLQHTEYEVRKKSNLATQNRADTQDWFLGRSRRGGGALMHPDLLKLVSKRSAAEAALLHEQRKADEAREHAKKNKQ